MSGDALREGLAKVIYAASPAKQPWNGDDYGWHEAQRRGQYEVRQAYKIADAILASGLLAETAPAVEGAEREPMAGEVWQEADGVLLLCIEPNVAWRDFRGMNVPWNAPTIARPLRRLLDAEGRVHE